MTMFLCGIATGIVLTLILLIALFLFVVDDDSPDDPCSGARYPLYGLEAEQKKSENSAKEVHKSWWFWFFITRHRAQKG